MLQCMDVTLHYTCIVILSPVYLQNNQKWLEISKIHLKMPNNIIPSPLVTLIYINSPLLRNAFHSPLYEQTYYKDDGVVSSPNRYNAFSLNINKIPCSFSGRLKRKCHRTGENVNGKVSFFFFCFNSIEH